MCERLERLWKNILERRGDPVLVVPKDKKTEMLRVFVGETEQPKPSDSTEVENPTPSVDLPTLGRQVPDTAPDWLKREALNLDQGSVQTALNQQGIGTKAGGSVLYLDGDLTARNNHPQSS